MTKCIEPSSGKIMFKFGYLDEDTNVREILNEIGMDLNKYREEVNKMVEDIRKEYDVTKTS